MSEKRLPIEYSDVVAAAERIKPYIVHTPLLENEKINERLGGRILFKPECLQRTGSFKLRGALNRLLQLTVEEKSKGVVAFSSGNHAAGVACAASQLGIDATIVMPLDAPVVKVENTRSFGANIHFYERFKEDRELVARQICDDTGATLVPSFNDTHIMAGQGTAGLEIAHDMGEMGLEPDQAVYCCGGGGLSSGGYTALKHHFPDMDAYISEPEGFDDVTRSLLSGERQFIKPGSSSICDALLTEAPGPLTFEVLQALEVIGLVVTDAEVQEAMKMLASHLKLIVEPGGAVALAALLSGKIETKDRVTICILSGGNVDLGHFSEIIAL